MSPFFYYRKLENVQYAKVIKWGDNIKVKNFFVLKERFAIGVSFDKKKVLQYDFELEKKSTFLFNDKPFRQGQVNKII